MMTSFTSDHQLKLDDLDRDKIADHKTVADSDTAYIVSFYAFFLTKYRFYLSISHHDIFINILVR